ncbi:MAG TPA: DUF1614 domain-containing protein [Pirellulales bacterium]|jgi:uncharacterized membrane protein|nr:DUF1614 domain-containing protein [Pirellulales bacterium]
MHPSQYHYPPMTWPFLVVLGILFLFTITLIELNVLRYAYERMGVSRRYVFALLLLSLLGSYINIPIAELPPEKVRSNEEVDYFGVRWVVPVVKQWPQTIVAVNLGGAIIPTLLSIYLIIRNALYLRGLIGVAIVAAIVHQLAHPVQGVGIAVPIFIPPIAAALVAVVLARIPLPGEKRGRESLNRGSIRGQSAHADSMTPDPFFLPASVAPALAYVVGSLGTLIGADLLNLDKVHGLGAPIASIGGAGTFDGIFLTGILAVLLA